MNALLRTKILLIAGASVALLGGTIAVSFLLRNQAEAPPQTSPKAENLRTQTECKAAGGVWNQWFLGPDYSCNIATRDKDKPCTDGAQCESGLCIANDARGGEGEGKCFGWQSIIGGCYTFIQNGKAANTICVD